MAITVLSCASWALWDSRVLPHGNVLNGCSGSCTGTRDVIRDVIRLGNGPVLPYPLAGFPTLGHQGFGRMALRSGPQSLSEQ